MRTKHRDHVRGGRHGFGGPGFGRPRRGRARRGDVRAAALALLAERPMHGYEMIQELDTRTSGVWRPSPGSVYPTLQLLEDEGLVTAADSDGKRRYSLTDAGREEAERLTEARPPWQQVTEGMDPSSLNLRHVFGNLFMAAKQVMDAGTDDQRVRAVELLDETRRRLYTILAEDPAAEA